MTISQFGFACASKLLMARLSLIGWRNVAVIKDIFLDLVLTVYTLISAIKHRRPCFPLNEWMEVLRRFHACRINRNAWLPMSGLLESAGRSATSSSTLRASAVGVAGTVRCRQGSRYEGRAGDAYMLPKVALALRTPAQVKP